MRRSTFIIVFILFIINLDFLYSQFPQITFKPSKGTELTSEDVDNILKENNLARNDRFECIIDNSVVKIKSSAFSECKGMQNVVFSESLNEIGSASFKHCSELTTVVFPSNSKLNKIDSSCFRGTSIEEVVFPKTLKKIGSFLFNEVLDITLQKLAFQSKEPPVFETGFVVSLTDYIMADTPLIVKVPKGSKKKYFNSIKKSVEKSGLKFQPESINIIEE